MEITAREDKYRHLLCSRRAKTLCIMGKSYYICRYDTINKSFCVTHVSKNKETILN